MTLQQIEYIIAVDEYRHFAKAAEYCRVTQPTLSAMIQKLEDELDTKIFDRSRQPVTPTPVGKIIIAQARQVLAEAGRIKDLVEEEKHTLSGVFHLGILPTIAPYLLPRFFYDFMRKYPHLDIRVWEMKTDEIKKALLDGSIDAGIVANLSGMEDYASYHLFYEEFFAYVSKVEEAFKSELVKTSDLQTVQLWLLDEGHCFRDQMVRFCQMKGAQQSQSSYRLGSMETFMRMVEGGRGVTFIPELAIPQLSDKQKELVRPFAIPRPAREITLLTNRTFVRHTLLSTLVTEIQHAVPKEMWQLKAVQQAI